MKNSKSTLIIFVLMCVAPYKVHAYIDPGTGSYFLQMLIAGLLGALFAIKMFWTSIKDFFKNLFGRKKDNDTQ